MYVLMFVHRGLRVTELRFKALTLDCLDRPRTLLGDPHGDGAPRVHCRPGGGRVHVMRRNFRLDWFSPLHLPAFPLRWALGDRVFKHEVTFLQARLSLNLNIFL